VHGERADISAAEEEWLYDKGIGGDSELSAIHGDDGLIFETIENGIAERGKENLLKQSGTEFAAAAVA
jgi:hypothetical protein